MVLADKDIHIFRFILRLGCLPHFDLRPLNHHSLQNEDVFSSCESLACSQSSQYRSSKSKGVPGGHFAFATKSLKEQIKMQKPWFKRLVQKWTHSNDFFSWFHNVLNQIYLGVWKFREDKLDLFT